MKIPRSLLLLALLILIKIALDYFAFYVSEVYGIYGIDVRGSWFSSQHILSWLIAVAVFVCALPYLTVCRDEVDFCLAFLLMSTFLPAASVFWVTEGSTDFFSFSAMFWGACSLLMFLLFRLSPWRTTHLEQLPVSSWQRWLSVLYTLMLVLLVITLIRNFHIGLDFGFDSVYDRRKEFIAWTTGGWTYLYAWSVYVFAAYLIFVSPSRVLKAFGLAYVLLFFLVAGDKVYLFLVFLMAAFGFLRGRRSAVVLMFAAIAFLFAMAIALDSLWLGFIVNRFVILPLGIAYKYAWHFAGEHLLYAYSFLAPFFDYRYAAAPSQIIGDTYYLPGDGANVNFLADAYVNLGWLAMGPLLAFFVSLRLMFRNSRYLILLCPPLIQLMNAPLPTVLVTGGGLPVLVACLLLSRRASRAAEAVMRSN